MNQLIQNMSSFFIAFNRPANYPHKLLAMNKFGKYLQYYSITDASAQWRQ